MADEFCLKVPDFHVTFRDLSHAVNLLHGTNGFTSLPKEGVLRIFSPWKIRRLRPGLNPRTWVTKANTLPLDHRSRSSLLVTSKQNLSNAMCSHFKCIIFIRGKKLFLKTISERSNRFYFKVKFHTDFIAQRKITKQVSQNCHSQVWHFKPETDRIRSSSTNRSGGSSGAVAYISSLFRFLKNGLINKGRMK